MTYQNRCSVCVLRRTARTNWRSPCIAKRPSPIAVGNSFDANWRSL